MGVNVRFGRLLVLRGSVCLGVGHLDFLIDVHILVLIFIHSLLLCFGEAFRIVLLKFFLSSLSDLGRANGGERSIRGVLGKQLLEHLSELVFFRTQRQDTEENNNLRTRVRFRFLLIFHN